MSKDQQYTNNSLNTADDIVISMRNVWAAYEYEPVLEDVNLNVLKGDFIGIIGPNGGGKTTLIKVILGLISPMQGEIRILGKDVRQRRSEIGYVPQLVEFDHNFPISVWEVVCMGLLGRRKILRRFTNADREIVAEKLKLVGMYSLRKRSIGELSGGQRQRVYVARALVADPKILLLDEPTASVDPQGSDQIYHLLQELNERISILMISHDMNVVSSYVKTVGCLNRRLYYHHEKQLSPEMVKAAYHCPVDLIAHGVPHRVLGDHYPAEGDQ